MEQNVRQCPIGIGRCVSDVYLTCRRWLKQKRRHVSTEPGTAHGNKSLILTGLTTIYLGCLDVREQPTQGRLYRNRKGDGCDNGTAVIHGMV